MKLPRECFFVYCRNLLGEDQYRVGVARLTDVPGNRENESLYMMIPVEPELARQLDKVSFRNNSTGEIVEIQVDRTSRDKIERSVSDESR